MLSSTILGAGLRQQAPSATARYVTPGQLPGFAQPSIPLGTSGARGLQPFQSPMLPAEQREGMQVPAGNAPLRSEPPGLDVKARSGLTRGYSFILEMNLLGCTVGNPDSQHAGAGWGMHECRGMRGGSLRVPRHAYPCVRVYACSSVWFPMVLFYRSSGPVPWPKKPAVPAQLRCRGSSLSRRRKNSARVCLLLGPASRAQSCSLYSGRASTNGDRSFA